MPGLVSNSSSWSLSTSTHVNSNQPSSSLALGSNSTNGVKTGFLKFFHRRLGYGFIVQDDNGPDVFFHHSQIPSYSPCTSSSYEGLHDECNIFHDNYLWGQPLEYRAERTSDGRHKATNVTGPNGAGLVFADPVDNR